MGTHISEKKHAPHSVAGRLLRWVVATALAMTGVVVLEVAASPPAAQAADVPWSCSQTAYLFQSPNADAAPHQVQSVDLVTGANSLVGTTADQINAVGYRTADNYMYAWNLRTHRLNRVNADLSLTDLGVPRGTTAAYTNVDYNVGDFDAAGNFWIMDNQTGKWLEISLADPAAPVTLAQGTAATPAGLVIPGDWVYLNGAFYGVANTASGSGNARLVSFNTTTHAFTVVGQLAGAAAGSTYGAAYSDGTYLYVSRNQGGSIYRIDVTAVSATLLSTGPAASSNDGARCDAQKVPTVTLVKNVGGRLVPDDQFVVTLVDPSGATVNSVSTTGTQTTARSNDQPVSLGTTYTIVDRLTPDSTSSVGDYTATLSCTTPQGGVGTSSPSIGAWTLTINSATDYTCVVTNTPVPRTPGLSLTKSVSPNGPGALVAGNTLTYRFVATNTGNVTLSNLRITDTQFSGTGSPPDLSGCVVATLAPNDQFSCAATYTVTQADVNAGVLTNTAVANGTDPSGGNVPSNPDSTSVTEPNAPALSLTKSASPLLVEKAGTTVTYTFHVTNAGNVTISDLAIAEGAFSGTGALGPATCEDTSLIPGASTDCTATYSVTQADIDAGVPITNTATATGTPPGGGTVTSNEDDATVLPYQTPHLTLTKAADPTTVDAAGETVTYNIEVTNDGNTTLDDLAIEEDSFSGSGTHPVISCPVLSLAPGQSTNCQGLYTVTQADIDAGSITNTAHAQGRRPDNGDAVRSNTDDAIVGVVPVQALSLVKTADPTTVSAPGAVVTYHYVVTNNGNQTITALAIAEVFNGTGTAPTPTCPVTTLAVGDSTTCTATYTVTQGDIDAGQITNVAHATGSDPAGNDVTSNDDDAVVTAPRHPALKLTKSADPTVVTAAGQTITYTYTITNTGNVTENVVHVVESHFTGTGTIPRPTCPAARAAHLAPGASLTCTATYTVRAGDLGGAPIDNVAYAAGNPPDGPPVHSTTAEAIVTSPVTPSPDRASPTVHTATSKSRVTPGQRFHDRVTVHRLSGRVSATARLYGPFASRAAASCRPAHLARSVVWQVHNGSNRSPSVKIGQPGVYTWKVTTHANAANLAGSHRCGLAAETTTVAKRSYPAPVINGGFSGVLLQQLPMLRVSLVTVSMPGIGLHAPVATEGISGGWMNLPDDVATVGRIGRSAGIADKIGTTVIAGHVSDRHDRPGAMYDLSRAQRGQHVTLRSLGKAQAFKVTSTATYVRGSALPQRYFTTTGRHRLVLVSCTDRVVYPNGHFHYTRYQVVVAKPVRHGR